MRCDLRYQSAADMRADLACLRRDSESGRMIAASEAEQPSRTGQAAGGGSSAKVPVASSLTSTRTLEMAHVLQTSALWPATRPTRVAA
jgi:RecA-family ATPase